MTARSYESSNQEASPYTSNKITSRSYGTASKNNLIENLRAPKDVYDKILDDHNKKA
jgi:hypothetical protein